MLNKKQALTILTLGLAVCSQVQAAGYYEDQPSSSSQRTEISDQEIAKRIQDKIGAGWFSKGYDKVNARVNSGIVTLQGSVKTEKDKEKVEKEVRNIDGVRGLDSHITVEERSQDGRQYQNRQTTQDGRSASRGNQTSSSNGSPAAAADQSSPNDFPQDRAANPTDKQLNQKIRDNISRGWFKNSYKNISLNTNNGAVLIEGFVDNSDDQRKIIIEVQKIEGVRTVRSNLQIQKP